MSLRIVPAILTVAVSMALGLPPVGAQQTQKPQPPQSLRLYVLDCGIITPPNVDNYGFKPNEVADTRMVTPCFLIVHPRGSLMWDTGEIPDSAFKDGVSPQKLNNYSVNRPLLPQLSAIGYTPANITYLALSHYHGDHVANARLFAGTTWIVQKGDRDLILAPRPANPPATGRVPDTQYFEGLANSKTILLNGEDHDVFGDGTVVIKYTPGHTPGTLSYVFPVKDRSRTVMVAYSGGTLTGAFGTDAARWDEYIASQRKIAKVAADAGASVILSNHSEYDGAYTKARLIAAPRQPGEDHPFVVGTDSVQRYFTVMAECATASKLRGGAQ